MENEAQRTHGVDAEAPLDPLSNYWGLSLFPQASSLTLPPSSSDPDRDLHAIHNHFRSMALRSPTKHMDQVKSVIDDNPALFKSEVSSDPTCDEENDVVAEEGNEFPRKRRPALGLKRARFSLKPTKNPSMENLVPILDIDKLKDPVQFFLAHERLENAKREIQKQMGAVSFEPNQDNASTKPRQRRPGLSENNQRPVRYRHRYPKETIDVDHVTSSQELTGSVSLGPSDENTDKGEACLTPFKNEVNESSAVEENKNDVILDGLLGCDSKDLEGAGAITLLQEMLQIKPIVLENISVPDFPDNQVIDLKSLHGTLSKPRKRKALSNIDNLLKGMNSTMPLRQDVGCSVQQSASPTPPRSPFAPFSSLQKHIARSKSSVDPFSAHEIDHLNPRKHSSTHSINQELNLLGSKKPSNDLSECIVDDGIAVSTTSSAADTVRNCASPSGKSKEDNSGMSSPRLNDPCIEDIIAVNETCSAKDTFRNCASTPEKIMKDNSRESEFNANIESNEHRRQTNTVDMIVDIGGSGVNDKIDRPNIAANGLNGIKDNADNLLAHATYASTYDSNFDLVNQLDHSDPAGLQVDATDKCTRREDGGPEQYLEENTDRNDMLPDDGQRRVKRSQKQYKDKSLSRRQSLAAAGTSWESGVRRSTRIRTRPLEYWKGERMVYGRVHQSLATVIGVKCISPGSDGKPTMKVKSYVSDQYKELLELASLY